MSMLHVHWLCTALRAVLTQKMKRRVWGRHKIFVKVPLRGGGIRKPQQRNWRRTTGEMSMREMGSNHISLLVGIALPLLPCHSHNALSVRWKAVNATHMLSSKQETPST